MSYIVSFVRFSPQEPVYPVNCWRSDVNEGDFVVVRMNSRGNTLKRAEVVHLAYLNWKCANSIECKASEASFTPHGIETPNPPKVHQGVNRPIDSWNVIREFGWKLHRTTSKSYKFACSARNASHVCKLFFRRNGLDIQITGLDDPNSRPSERLSFSPNVGQTERMDCRNTETNFYVYVCDVAEAFSQDRDYRDVKRPAQSIRPLPWAAPGKDEEPDWRDAFRGLPGPVYLHDGQYL